MSRGEPKALLDLLARQHGVVARRQALECGVSIGALRHRLRPGGVWRPLLPGVYLTNTGVATDDQRDMAALLYAGPRGVITGLAALRRHRLSLPGGECRDLLIPAATRRANVGFARVHRSVRMPERVCMAGEIAYALPDRAVADAARGLAYLREVRAVVAAAVQRGICPVPLLAAEVEAGPSQGSALLRRAIAEVSDGVRSTAEADLRDLVQSGRLPAPMFNPRLFVGRVFLAVPDCWWPQAGVAVEVDSREWHIAPRDWEKTLARHARMSAHGVIVLHFTPRQIRFERERTLAAIRAALTSGSGRPLPAIRAVPA